MFSRNSEKSHIVNRILITKQDPTTKQDPQRRDPQCSDEGHPYASSGESAEWD